MKPESSPKIPFSLLLQSVPFFPSTAALQRLDMAASGTWFDTIKKSFADVPVDNANDNGIATTEFLEAAESLTTLFGMLHVYSN